jgi:hypothetical protein
MVLFGVYGAIWCFMGVFGALWCFMGVFGALWARPAASQCYGAPCAPKQQNQQNQQKSCYEFGRNGRKG